MKVYVFERTEYEVEVRFSDTVITFEGTKAKEDANRFVLELLKSIGKIGY